MKKIAHFISLLLFATGLGISQNDANNHIANMLSRATASEGMLLLEQFYDYGVSNYGSNPQGVVDSLGPLAENTLALRTDGMNEMMGKNLNILGTSLKRLQRPDEGLQVLLLAVKYFEKMDQLNPRILPSMYNNIGNSLRELGDYSNALNYFDQAARLMDSFFATQGKENQNQQMSRIYSSILINKGLILSKLNYQDRAINFYQKALEIGSDSNTADLKVIYGNLGISHELLGDYTNAKKYYTEALHHSKSENLRNAYFQNSINLLSIYAKTNESENFSTYASNLRQELSAERDSPLHASLLAKTYIQEALLYEQSGNFTKSISCLDQSVEILHPGQSARGVKEVLPLPLSSSFPYLMIEIYTIRSRIGSAYGLQQRNLTPLEESLQYLKAADYMIDSLRSALSSQESKIMLNEIQKTTYRTKADLCRDLFNFTGEKGYLEELFATSERGKTAGLWSEIQQKDLKSEYIPNELLKKETDLRNQMAQVGNQINQLLRRNETMNNEEIARLERKRFGLNESLDSILHVYNQNFPQYYNLKFNNETITLDTLQNSLSDSQVFIQLFLSDNFIHQIALTNDSLIYRSINNPERLINAVTGLLEIYKPRRFDYTNSDTKEYASLAYSIYRELFEPMKDLIEHKTIILSPDDKFNLIPFEALIQSDHVDHGTDFRDLDYMIYAHDFSYTYTATLWSYHYERLSKKRNRGSILAFAPYYERSPDLKEYARVYGESLPPLPGTLEEIAAIKQLFAAKTFRESKATEKNLKDHIDQASILHLAMHTIIDNDEPLNSFLVFFPDTAGSEDGRLSASEVLNYQLRADLTVLSACNTGSGKIREGEGIMGLARSFIQAGCPSLLLNLWAMDDRSGTAIIKNFYTHLAAEQSLSVSLRKAKLQHLRTAKKLNAHPHYWAGIVLQGSDAVLEIPNRNTYWWFSLLLLFPVGGFIWLIRKKKALNQEPSI